MTSSAGVHPLGEEALQIGMNRPVLPTMYQLGFDFQAVPPTFASNRSGFGTPCVAKTSFFLLGQIAGEIINAVWKQPDASVLDVDVGEDRCPREIGLLRLRSLVRVRSKRAEVNQADNAIVGSGAGDDPSPRRLVDVLIIGSQPIK